MHRDVIWELHLHSFQAMLPFFMRYDHFNYAHWGTIYLNDMNQLPVDVQIEFQDGNFVVKRAKLTFNQVSPDQSQEWLNGTGKRGGGIIGIAKTSSALSRWALSYNVRSHLSCETKAMLGMNAEEIQVHNEANTGRNRLDNKDEDALLATLMSLNVFSNDSPSKLHNIVTKDIATDQITDNLLNAKQKGQEQLNTFVEEWLLPTDHRKLKFRDPITKSKALTFSSLYDVPNRPHLGKEQVLKADRSILHRLIIAYEARRNVDLDQILCHELLPVPISLAEFNGNL